MSDLISRKAVMKFLSEKNKNGMPESATGRATYGFIENLIDEIRDDIPVAYDVDKVVGTMKEYATDFDDDSDAVANMVISDLISIVKGGGQG